MDCGNHEPAIVNAELFPANKIKTFHFPDVSATIIQHFTIEQCFVPLPKLHERKGKLFTRSPTHFDAFPPFSTLSISFFSATNLLMMDEQFSSIARRKLDETATGAATGTEKFLSKAVRAPEPSWYYFHIDLKAKGVQKVFINRSLFMTT